MDCPLHRFHHKEHRTDDGRILAYRVGIRNGKSAVSDAEISRNSRSTAWAVGSRAPERFAAQNVCLPGVSIDRSGSIVRP